jgi:4-amino-4-deoxychorismate lyase
MESDHDSYALISTTRYDPYLIQLNYNNEPGNNPSPFFLLSYHIDRIIDAANRHGWQRLLPSLEFAAVKSICERAVPQHSGMDGPNSCRV